MHFNIKWRLLYLAIGIAVFVISYSIGAATEINRSEAENIRQQFGEGKVKDIDQTGIFVNNLWISLVMFIPALGIGFGIFTGFSTGFAANAIAESSPLLSNLTPYLDLIKPFGAMEVFVYGLAMSRSGMLIYQIIKKKPWREYVIITTIEIGIVIVVLLVAAIIEWNIITRIMEQARNPA